VEGEKNFITESNLAHNFYVKAKFPLGRRCPVANLIADSRTVHVRSACRREVADYLPATCRTRRPAIRTSSRLVISVNKIKYLCKTCSVYTYSVRATLIVVGDNIAPKTQKITSTFVTTKLQSALHCQQGSHNV